MLTYTFHVSLPGYGRVWRKVELPAVATLEDLHLAIQNAYTFDNDHLYSFFMSGKAWDQSTEYNLPEGVTPWDNVFAEDEDEFEEADDLRITAEELALADAVAGLPDPTERLPDEPLETPTPDQLRAMFAQLKEDPQAREQFMQAISTQLGLPPLMAQMMMGNIDTLVGSLSDEQLAAILSTEPNDLGAIMGGGFLDGGDAGDVRTTTLETLALKKGKKFLYLFDYGDEWRFDVKVHAINPDADPALDYPLLVESVGEAPIQYPDWDEADDEADDDEE